MISWLVRIFLDTVSLRLIEKIVTTPKLTGFILIYLCLVYILGSWSACLPAWLIDCVLKVVYENRQAPYLYISANAPRKASAPWSPVGSIPAASGRSTVTAVLVTNATGELPFLHLLLRLLASGCSRAPAAGGFAGRRQSGAAPGIARATREN